MGDVSFDIECALDITFLPFDVFIAERAEVLGSVIRRVGNFSVCDARIAFQTRVA